MKTHLLYRGKGACGIDTHRTTRSTQRVTCLSCQRTLAMADAEAREGNQRNRRTTRSQRGQGRKRE